MQWPADDPWQLEMAFVVFRSLQNPLPAPHEACTFAWVSRAKDMIKINMSAVWAVNEVYKYQMHWSFDAPCHLGTFCEVRLKLRITTWSMNVRLCDKCERYRKISSKATRQLQNKSIMNLFAECNGRLMVHDSWDWLSWCFKVRKTHFQRHMKHTPLFECQGRKIWS